jgi:dephospho-CoA kinase
MLRVALTGGIATGKSYVADRLASRGIPVIDADAVARDVVAPGTDAADAIRRRFGDDLFTAEGQLDRKALGDIVFADAGARRELEGLVHPAVRARIDSWFAELTRSGTAVAMAVIPLLFEAGRDHDFDIVAVTTCDDTEQERRVMARDHSTRDAARARIAAQWPSERKLARAHYVIRTDGAFAETDRLVDELYRVLMADAFTS